MNPQVKSVLFGALSGLTVVSASYLLSGKKGGETKRVD